MRRQPPRSTLPHTSFPYTTLFRSRLRLAGGAAPPPPPPRRHRAPARRHRVEPDRGCRRPALRADRLADQSGHPGARRRRSEEHTSELQSLMRISYAVFCLKKKTYKYKLHNTTREERINIIKP